MSIPSLYCSRKWIASFMIKKYLKRSSSSLSYGVCCGSSSSLFPVVHHHHHVAAFGGGVVRGGGGKQQQQQQWRRTLSSSKMNSSSSSSNSSSAAFTQQQTSAANVMDVINNRIDRGELRRDKSQERAIKKLNRLQKALVGYDNNNSDTAIKNNTDRDDKNNDNNNNNNNNNNKTNDSGNKKLNRNDNILDNAKNEGIKNEGDTNNSNNNNKDIIPTPQKKRKMIPRGLYLYGDVGCGKSMIMDTFYMTIQNEKKRRYHYNEFMLYVHARIYQMKQSDLQSVGRNFHIDTNIQNNPVHRLATQLSTEITVLCLDEFQVTDIADAFILSQLFQTLFVNGTILITTSNRPPLDLYENGVNRAYFLPFIGLLERHCIVHDMRSSTDYRRLLSSSSSSSFFLVNSSKKALEEQVDQIIQKVLIEDDDDDDDDDEIMEQQQNDSHMVDAINGPEKTAAPPVLSSMELKVSDQRSIQLKAVDVHSNLIGTFNFTELCDRNFGARDYRAIGNTFNIVVIQNIPILIKNDHHNRARRFITLIDELYETKCALVCTSTALSFANTQTTTFTEEEQEYNPKRLFVDDEDDEEDSNNTNEEEKEINTTPCKKDHDEKSVEEGKEQEISTTETMDIDEAQIYGGKSVSTLASIRELSFAFKRAASRITEMCSQHWWDRVLSSDEYQQKTKKRNK